MSLELAKEPLQITEGFCTVDKVQGEATNTVLEDWIFWKHVSLTGNLNCILYVTGMYLSEDILQIRANNA